MAYNDKKKLPEKGKYDTVNVFTALKAGPDTPTSCVEKTISKNRVAKKVAIVTHPTETSTP